jgi:hypothetical protein
MLYNLNYAQNCAIWRIKMEQFIVVIEKTGKKIKVRKG